jgi:putative nucleotidyltransferase with HDIG domain
MGTIHTAAFPNGAWRPVLHTLDHGNCGFRDLPRALATSHDVVAVSAADVASLQPGAIVLCDVEGIDGSRAADLRAWRERHGAFVGAIVFIGQDRDRRELLKHGLLRDANFMRRPLDGVAVSALLAQLSAGRFGAQADPAVRRRLHDANPGQATALRACESVLDELFGAFATREVLNARAMAERSGVVVDTLKETGLSQWVLAVREHHDLTYQHCLLVTGTLVSFGRHLGVREADLQRLATGGLLHDVGKAGIPLDILDKPGALTAEERAIMQRHPSLGVARLMHAEGIMNDLLMLVRDHHEYLDGSGYPAGLQDASIPDTVRLLTIADIFAALIEKRAYKPPLSSEAAVAIMEKMHGKLDMALLRAVAPVMRRVVA